VSDALHSTLEFVIHGYDCGYGGPLRAFALVNFLQEAAGENATRLGFGMDDLHARGWTWMLSRLDLRVDRLPRDGEKVFVKTWPAGTHKLFAYRDIAMSDAEGRSLVRAVYAYLIVDIAARRPLRPESIFGPVPPQPGDPHPVPDFSYDIPLAVDPVLQFTQCVRGRHIDHNGHANNAHLVNWLVDASGCGESLSALRVEFAAEALEGDLLAAARGEPRDGSPFGGDIASSSALAELRCGETRVARALVGRR